MRNPLLTTERAKYESIWALESYAAHSPGERALPVFLDMAKPSVGASVLDAGCGSGKGAVALRAAGFNVTCCDLTAAGLSEPARDLPFVEACLWDDLTPHVGAVDYVYCCDVLEHIPTAMTMLVIARLLAVARCGVFLSISTVPDSYGAWVGESLHQTVQPFVWWRDNLRALGNLVEGRDMLAAGMFLVEPR